jgi:hypothetical protein
MVGRWDFVELIGLSLFYLFRLGWITGSSFVRLCSRKFDRRIRSVDGGSDVMIRRYMEALGDVSGF